MSANPSLIVRRNPPTLAAPPGYSHVVEARGGRTLWIAGQVALDAEGRVVGEGDVAAQAEQVFRSLAAALEAVGAGFGDVVKLNTYVLDRAALPAFRAARDRYIRPDQAPASTLVLVAALFRPEFLIEVEAVAAVAG